MDAADARMDSMLVSVLNDYGCSLFGKMYFSNGKIKLILHPDGNVATAGMRVIRNKIESGFVVDRTAITPIRGGDGIEIEINIERQK